LKETAKMPTAAKSVASVSRAYERLPFDSVFLDGAAEGGGEAGSGDDVSLALATPDAESARRRAGANTP
jgi:hypothetical protein